MDIQSFLQMNPIPKEYFPLLEYVLHQDIHMLIVNNTPIPHDALHTINTLIDDAKRGTPIPYLTHLAYFYKDSFYVNHDVLIPRPETEYLVERAIQYISLYNKDTLDIYDVCTGSGCIGLSIAKYVSSSHHIHLTDISRKALEICEKNLKTLFPLIDERQNVQIIESDLLKDIDFSHNRNINVLISNPPYIPSHVIETLQTHVKDFEPHIALDGGIHGYEVPLTLLREASAHMAEHFLILIEIDETYGKYMKSASAKIFPHAQVTLIQDLFKKDRYIEIIG